MTEKNSMEIVKNHGSADSADIDQVPSAQAALDSFLVSKDAADGK